MELVLSLVVGSLTAVGFYLMLRRTLAQLILGLALLTNAVNLAVFTVGGLTRGGAPLVRVGESAPDPGAADPLPQALVLTAIVIGFGVVAFFTVLAYRAYLATGTDDVDTFVSSDTSGPSPEPSEVVEQPLPIEIVRR